MAETRVVVHMVIAAQSPSNTAVSKVRTSEARSSLVVEVHASIRTLHKVQAGNSTDWEIVRNHDDDQQTADLDIRFKLQIYDGAVIYLQTSGTSTGQREVLESRGKEDRDPTEYRIRVHVTAERGDPRYSWLNQAVIIASSGRPMDMAMYDAYQVQ